MVGVASNTTEVPEQIIVLEALMATAGDIAELTVMLTVFDVEFKGDAHASEDDITQLTRSPEFNVLLE